MFRDWAEKLDGFEYAGKDLEQRLYSHCLWLYGIVQKADEIITSRLTNESELKDWTTCATLDTTTVHEKKPELKLTANEICFAAALLSQDSYIERISKVANISEEDEAALRKEFSLREVNPLAEVAGVLETTLSALESEDFQRRMKEVYESRTPSERLKDILPPKVEIEVIEE